jgi:N-acetylglutamate synthase-like GNAT family acetyltransferase
MRILRLNKRPQYIEVIAKWLFDEWGYQRPGSNLETTIHRIEERSQGNHVPSIFVAEINGKAVGTVSLVRHDMDIRKVFSPWVASLYVHKDLRHKQIGRKLMHFIEHFAKDMDIKQIYLFTPNKQEMYTKLDWRAIEDLEYLSEDVTIMSKDL